MTEEYAVGYSEGYQTGWNEATDSIPERQPLTEGQILEANTFKWGKFTCVHVQVEGEPESIIGLVRAIEAAHGIGKKT
jgi:hypothetical protein